MKQKLKKLSLPRNENGGAEATAERRQGDVQEAGRKKSPVLKEQQKKDAQKQKEQARENFRQIREQEAEELNPEESACSECRKRRTASATAK